MTTNRSRWRTGRAGALIVALALPVGLSAQTRALSHLGRSEGLPSTRVRDIAFDDRGFPWFAGPAGLARHEGARIRTYGTADGLSSQGLRALARDRSGRLWIGTDVGVDLRDTTGSVRPLLGEAAWPYGAIDAIEPADGGVWIASAAGLLRWSDGIGLERVPGALEGHAVASISLDSSGRAWAASPTAGLFRETAEGFVALDRGTWQSVSPLRVVLAARGSVFVGGDRGLVEISISGGQRASIESVGGDRVTALAIVGRELWVGVGDRILELAEHPERGWQTGEVLATNTVANRIVRGPGGSVWIGTDGDGLIKVSVLAAAIRRFELPCGPHVHALRADADGGLLVGGETCSMRVTSTTGARARLPGLDGIKTWDLLEDRAGRGWAATQNGLYTAPPGGRFARALGSEALATTPGRALLELGDGRILVGTLTGLFEIDGELAEEVLSPGGRGLGYVFTLAAEPAGDDVWIGTVGNGAWRLRPGQPPRRARIDLLGERSNVYAVALARDGSRAFVQDDQIVVARGQETWLLPPATQDSVAGWSALYDADGRLWVGGNSGLVAYDPNGRRVIQRLVSSMGLTGDEFTTSRSLLAGPGGLLYCGLDQGLSVIDPSRLDGLLERPDIELASVRWSNAELSGDATVIVRPGRWALEVDAASNWFADERSLLFRHRLAGFDEQWGAASPAGRHQIHYAGLPPGRYAIEAQAFSPLTGWGPPAQLLSFVVAPYWWQSRPFLALWSLLFVAAVLALWSRRSRVHSRRALALEQMVEERTAELESSKKALEHLATHDVLTGLANQRLFWDRAARFHARANRGTAAFALILFDLDRFKRVNDSRGHHAGDELLRQIAERLDAHTRGQDLLARYGGEEFAMLVDSRSAGEATQAAERLRSSLSDAPFVVDEGDPIRCTASFGVAQWQIGQDLNALFRLADAALYQAKKKRNSVACAPTPEARDDSARRLSNDTSETPG